MAVRSGRGAAPRRRPARSSATSTRMLATCLEPAPTPPPMNAHGIDARRLRCCFAHLKCILRLSRLVCEDHAAHVRSSCSLQLARISGSSPSSGQWPRSH